MSMMLCCSVMNASIARGSALRECSLLLLLTVVLFSVNSLNVDDILASVHLSHLAITTLEGSADNLDLIILADGDRANLEEK